MPSRNRSFITIFLTAVVLFLIMGGQPQPHLVQAAGPPIEVNTTNVLNDANDGSCDLYEALQASFSQFSLGDDPTIYHECTAHAGAKEVIFSGAAAGGIITLPTGPGTLVLPMINGDVTFIGPVTLDGAGEKRLLSVAAPGELTLLNLVLQNGHTAGGGGAILSSQAGKINLIGVSLLGNTADNDGGAINTTGDLNIMASNFAGNDAGRDGGAVYQGSSFRDLQLSLSTFNGNTAVKTGGALTIHTDNAEISDTTFNGNILQDDNPDSSTKGGGAIYLDGAELTIERTVFNGNISLDGPGGAIATSLSTELHISDSAFNGNIAGDPNTAHLGGAIYNMEIFTIRGATFLNNLSPKGNGGAIFNDKGGELTAANASFIANGALDGDGGALYNGNTQQGSNIDSQATLSNVTLFANLANNEGSTFFNQAGDHMISLANVIVAGSGSPTASCNRDLTTLGHNIDSGNSCGFSLVENDLINTDPMLEAPSFNGGPLADLISQLPGENSPAIDAGDNDVCAAAPVNNEDQRGDTRPKDGNASGTAVCDIGATETDARIPGYGSMPVWPGPIVIGTTLVNTPVTNHFTVEETGDAALDVSNPVFGGANAAEFELVSNFTSFTIADGGADVDIEIRCTPTATGTRTATLSLTTNDPDHPSVSYDLLCYSEAVPTPGFGSDPATPGPLDFGVIELGNNSSRNLTIFETGTATLTFGNANLSGPNPDDFTFNAFPTSIVDGGADVTIPITCTPSDIGLRSATLTMTTNDPIQPQVSWSLVCEGIPPPPPFLEDPGQSVDTPINLMDGIYGVAVSPEGNHLYATAFLDDWILTFARDAVNGTLTYQSAINTPNINGPQLIAVSPDGEQVYVANGLAHTFVIFGRSSASGNLTQLQWFTDGALPLTGAYGVAVSPDGRFIYVSSLFDGSITGFERLADDTIVYRSANSVVAVDLLEARNLTVSPDGKNLYATAYSDTTGDTGNIITYAIDTQSGALTHKQTISEGDWVGGPFIFIQLNAIGGAFDVTVSPDGQQVYVVGTFDGSIIKFDRDPVDGTLTYGFQVLSDGFAGVDGLDGVSGIDVSPDGRHIFATGYNDAAVAVFARDTDNGRLDFIQVIKRSAPSFLPQLLGARDIDVSPDGTSVHAAAFLDDAVVSLHQLNPIPLLETLLPASATVGDDAFTLTVQGEAFLPGATVQLNGVDKPTTYISPSTLEAAVSAADIAAAGDMPVTVTNPAPGGGLSLNDLTFTVTAPAENPVPSIASLMPQGAAAGDGQLTLTVLGTNFIGESAVQWKGAARTTTFVSESELTITLTTADLAIPGTAVVSVINPSPGGGTSNPAAFDIAAPFENPTPTIISLEPESTTAYGAASGPATIRIHGSNFVEGAQAQWNGEDRPTQFIDESEVEITLYGFDVAFPGWGDITVSNPTPGGGTSNTIQLQVYAYSIFLPAALGEAN